MKIYEIIDEELSLSIGVLLYYEKEGTWIIELQGYLDEWNAPLLLSGYVKKKIYTIPRDVSLLWVRERIIPPGRQNIQSILSEHKLREYDERRFLELSGGRCSQDSMYIRKREDLPEYVTERMRRNLQDCLISSDTEMLCFFRDGAVRKIDLSDLSEMEGAEKLRRNRDLFLSGRILAGGYGVTFDNAVDIPAAALYRIGLSIPLKMDHFLSFARKNVLDTSEACRTLDCSRQNLSYLVGEGRIAPIRTQVRGNLYLKGDVLRNTW